MPPLPPADAPAPPPSGPSHPGQPSNPGAARSDIPPASEPANNPPAVTPNGKASTSAAGVAPPSANATESNRDAPEYALWLGGRLGLLTYGGGFFRDPPANAIETTGNFVRPGVGLQVDVGARLASRYIPYLALELGLMGPGHRFDQAGAQASTYFYGIGVRYVAGDVNRIGYVGDISLGFRRIQISSGSSTWDASGFEIFRLGLGLDVRVQRRITISPMATLSGGTLTDTRGDVAFGPNQGDGRTGPAFANGSSIPSNSQASYYTVSVGCGIHADLLGH